MKCRKHYVVYGSMHDCNPISYSSSILCLSESLHCCLYSVLTNLVCFLSQAYI